MRVKWLLEGSSDERVHRLALMVEMGLTSAQFKGGKLAVSHRCHETICVNPVHLVPDPLARKLQCMLLVTPLSLHFKMFVDKVLS